MDRVLGGWTSAGDCTTTVADAIRAAVYAGNAQRIYQLDDRHEHEEIR
jgi:hypothetical protein